MWLCCGLRDRRDYGWTNLRRTLPEHNQNKFFRPNPPRRVPFIHGVFKFLPVGMEPDAMVRRITPTHLYAGFSTIEAPEEICEGALGGKRWVSLFPIPPLRFVLQVHVAAIL
jgi:hypothetical protein